MSCVGTMVLYGAGITLVVVSVILLLGWTFYKDAQEAEEMDARRQISSQFIRIITLSIVVFISFICLIFTWAVGEGTCH